MKINDLVVKIQKNGKESKYSLVDFLKHKTRLDLKTKPDNQKQEQIKIEISNRNNEETLETIPDVVEYTDFEISNLNNIKNEQLKELISDLALEPLVGDETNIEKLNFAKMDYDQVHRETIDIKSCRTNIFVAVLSVLGAIGVAIIGLKTNPSFNRWLFLASLLPLLLLTAAILSTFHKARGLNRRLSYLEALSEYLSRGKTPQYWRSWPKAQRVSEKCLCGFKKDKDNKQFCSKQEQCKETAKKNAIPLDKYLPSFPHLLKNFTSLTGHCYFTAYLITVICSIYALITTLNVRYGISFQDFYKPCLAGLLGGLAVSILNRFDKSKAKNVFYGIVIFLLIAVPIIFSLLAASESQHKWAIYSSYIFGTIFFVFIIYVGNVLVEQSKNINIGRYSIERFYQIWKYRMHHCIYMNK